jgi:hypothetical protein
MDVSDITPQLDQLEEELKKAEDSLEPLLGDIGDISSKLPLLDKAKLYVLVAYAIEALLFCETWPPCPPLSVHSHLASDITPQRRGYEEPCHLHGIDPCKAVHRKDPKT